jgi:hypothetical protein
LRLNTSSIFVPTRLSLACPHASGCAVADFALAGQKALDGPDCASRMAFFRLYYLGLAPCENARHFLGLSERGWVNWTAEVRHRCGKEMLWRRMFPPRKYFREAA